MQLGHPSPSPTLYVYTFTNNLRNPHHAPRNSHSLHIQLGNYATDCTCSSLATSPSRYNGSGGHTLYTCIRISTIRVGVAQPSTRAAIPPLVLSTASNRRRRRRCRSEEPLPNVSRRAVPLPSSPKVTSSPADILCYAMPPPAAPVPLPPNSDPEATNAAVTPQRSRIPLPLLMPSHSSGFHSNTAPTPPLTFISNVHQEPLHLLPRPVTSSSASKTEGSHPLASPPNSLRLRRPLHRLYNFLLQAGVSLMAQMARVLS